MNEGEEHFSEFTVTQMHHPWQASPLFESEDIRSLSLPLKATHCCPKPPERHQTWDKTRWRNRRELGVSETQNRKTAASLSDIHLCVNWSSCYSSNKVPSVLFWTESDAFTTDARWEAWACDIRKRRGLSCGRFGPWRQKIKSNNAGGDEAVRVPVYPRSAHSYREKEAKSQRTLHQACKVVI